MSGDPCAQTRVELALGRNERSIPSFTAIRMTACDVNALTAYRTRGNWDRSARHRARRSSSSTTSNGVP